MNVYLITGASKGIGHELAKQLSLEGNFVIGVARTETAMEGIIFIEGDLAETEKLEELMEVMFSMAPANATSFTLINNAATVDPIGRIGTIKSTEITHALAVNLNAPIILSNAFISQLSDFKGTKRIINISSGAGRHAYEGWGTYCATKAGIDHFTRVVALEQIHEDYPVEIVSIAPGIIDTTMQEKIRKSSVQDFPLLDRFIDYKSQGQLSSAGETASKLKAFMTTNAFSKGEEIMDIRDV